MIKVEGRAGGRAGEGELKHEDLGNVIHLGELESDAQASKERGQEGAGAGEGFNRDVNSRILRAHGGGQIPEGLRYLPERPVALHRVRHLDQEARKLAPVCDYGFSLPLGCRVNDYVRWHAPCSTKGRGESDSIQLTGTWTYMSFLLILRYLPSTGSYYSLIIFKKKKASLISK